MLETFPALPYEPLANSRVQLRNRQPKRLKAYSGQWISLLEGPGWSEWHCGHVGPHWANCNVLTSRRRCRRRLAHYQSDCQPAGCCFLWQKQTWSCRLNFYLLLRICHTPWDKQRKNANKYQNISKNQRMFEVVWKFKNLMQMPQSWADTEVRQDVQCFSQAGHRRMCKKFKTARRTWNHT